MPSLTELDESECVCLLGSRVVGRLGLVTDTPAPVIVPVNYAVVDGSIQLLTTDHGLGGGGWFGLLAAMFDRFLTVSRFSASVLGVPADRTRVIYGGADPQRFVPDPAVSRDGVLFLGRLTPTRASTGC